MSVRKDIIEAVSEIARSQVGLTAFMSQLKNAGSTWLRDLSKRAVDADEAEVDEALVEISSIISALLPQAGTSQVNSVLGKALSLLIGVERRVDGSRRLMKRLVGPQLAEIAQEEQKQILVINPGISSTKITWLKGLTRQGQARVHNSPDVPDTVEQRMATVLERLAEWGVDLKKIQGVTCRSGFVKPVSSGSYRIIPQMLQDLRKQRSRPADDMSIPLGMQVAQACGGEDSVLLVTTDPLSCDEVEPVERLTGHVKIRRDGGTAHYLNHKAANRVLASCLGNRPEELSLISAHLGSAGSLARHHNGKVTALLDTFSGIPSTNHSGTIDARPLLDAMLDDELNVKEFSEAVYAKGGLLSLAGTNDFRALISFRRQGANTPQSQKIEILLNFFARRIAAAFLQLSADGLPVDLLAISGGLTKVTELAGRVEANLADRYPLVWLGGTLADDALAAGLIRCLFQPEQIKDYVQERAAQAEKQQAESRLLDTVIFEREVLFKKRGSPIVSANELIDAARIAVHQEQSPDIAVVGADNEEALLASKRANEEGRYRIARFNLVGDSAAINEIAYELDLVIDDDNYTIVDTEDPIGHAIGMLESGQAQILMKGSVKTEKLLKGVFRYLKDSGRLKEDALLSHVVAMDLPRMNKLLMITDAAVNPYPDEAKKVKIIENALKVAKCLNIRIPKVAVISAIESVNVGIESSIEAERIAAYFEDRKDCIVEGPVSFDVATNPEIADEKHYPGEIQGTADILVMPDIDSANVLYKTLTTQSGATAAGVILCGDMPLVLNSRGDSARTKFASIALAVKIYFDLQKKNATQPIEK
jgi:butyrate kinase